MLAAIAIWIEVVVVSKSLRHTLAVVVMAMVGERRAVFRDRPSHLNRDYLAVCSAARLPAI